MSKTRMPYQCLQRCGSVLIGARGSSIDSFSLHDGSLLSTWKCSPTHGIMNGTGKSPAETTKQNSESPSVDIVLDKSSPSAKRRKLSTGRDDDGKMSAKEGEKKVNNRPDSVASGLGAPAVTALATTNDGRHVIAVTGEDKTIRVFENAFERNGASKQQLCQLSQRVMPKRPCALVITEDDSTIISADKFGDVYSLPLLPSETTVDCSVPGDAVELTSEIFKPMSRKKPFVPAANDLTVHSQRNRKALENQKRQTNQPPEKSEPTFEHKLLLGHVSMLTDISLVALESRYYIITADRDEHIRISHGIPQTHIIEGYCLGHSEFVSRLCVPKERSNILISGGGDDDLLVWDFKYGKLLSTTNLKSHVVALVQELDDDRRSEDSGERSCIAVSGICHTRQNERDGFEDVVIATCEGVPALFCFLLTAQNQLEYRNTLRLAGNALAVVCDVPMNLEAPDTVRGLIVSIDTIHKPGSMIERRCSTDDSINPLQCFVPQHCDFVQREIFELPDQTDVTENGTGGRFTNFLYNLENLRKSSAGTQEEE